MAAIIMMWRRLWNSWVDRHLEMKSEMSRAMMAL
jgi:hypothetical protein